MEIPFVNTRILSHPLNWIEVALMLVIAGVAGHFLLSYFDQEPATANSAALSGYNDLPAGYSPRAPFDVPTLPQST